MYKIEVADVRITPEELKRTEDYIASLEEKVKSLSGIYSKTEILFQKLNRCIDVNAEELKIAFGEDDYDVFISQNLAINKVSIRFNQPRKGL